MALDFNQRSFTKTADQAVIDEGLRAYMLKVYNYMTTGLLVTGLIAYFFGKASIVTNSAGEITNFSFWYSFFLSGSIKSNSVLTTFQSFD